MSNTYSRKQKFWAAVLFCSFFSFPISPGDFFLHRNWLSSSSLVSSHVQWQSDRSHTELQIYQQLKGKTKMIWNGCWNINLTSDTWCSNIATVCVRKWLFCSDVQTCTDRKTTHSHMLDLYSSWYPVFTEKLRSIHSHCSLTIAPVMNRE